MGWVNRKIQRGVVSGLLQRDQASYIQAVMPNKPDTVASAVSLKPAVSPQTGGRVIQSGDQSPGHRVQVPTPWPARWTPKIKVGDRYRRVPGERSRSRPETIAG